MISDNMKRITKSTLINIILIILLPVPFYSCHISHNAKWITPQGDPGKPDQWICFRKEINISTIPQQELAQIAVDSKYWLWINDSLIIRDGSLLRNINPEDTWYDEVNIAPFLKEGKNVLAVLVNYFGRGGLNHNSSGKAGLYFNSTSVKSDASWKVMVHPAYYSLRDENSNYRYAVQSIGFNSNADVQWTKLTFDDREWAPAVVVGEPTVAPWNKLIKRPIPQFKDYGLSYFLKTDRKGDTIIATLPYAAQVNPYFKIRAHKNQKIEICSDTYSLGNLRHANSIKTEYICREGLQEYEMPHWISGQKIFFILPSDVEIEALMFRETGYDTSLKRRFVSDDPFLNTLWEKCQRTLYICTREYYMDCPDRERSQYGGDVANMINQSFYAFDTTIYALDRNSLLNVFHWQRPDSTIYMPYGGTANEELPLQMLYLTGYHGIYQYFLYTGDTATVRSVFPAIKTYHALWQTDERGLVKQRKGDWYWRDWGANIDERLLDNVLYADALRSDIEFARVLGDEQDLKFYQNKYDELKKAINTNYWDGDAYRSTGFTSEPDDRGNAIAVLAGIADSSKFDEITSVLKKSFFASTYMERFVSEALFQMNETRTALERMKTRYNDMVYSPYTTIWEQWTYNGTRYSTSTYNHGWSCSPLHLLSQYISGIKPLAPGFSYYQIIPKTPGLHRVSCMVESPAGTIDVRMDFEQWQYLMEIYSPPSTVVRVGIPKRYYHNILKINGTILRNRVGRKNREVENIMFTGEDAGYFYYDMKPGKWLVEAF